MHPSTPVPEHSSLRRWLAYLVTPAEPQPNDLALLRAQGFFTLCWLIVTTALLAGALLWVREGRPEVLGSGLLLGAIALYAHRRRYSVGQYLIVAVGAVLSIVPATISRSAEVEQVSLLGLSALILLAGLCLPFLVWLGYVLACFVALVVLLPLWESWPLSLASVFLLVSTALGVLILRLLWEPLTQAYFTAQQADLLHTMSVVRKYTVGFLYRVVVDADGQHKLDIVFGSPETTVGQTSQHLMAIGGWQAYMHPQDRSLLETHWQQALATSEHIVEYRLQSQRAGEWLWVRDHAVVQANGKARLIHGVLRDITGEKRAEANLRTYVLQQAVIAELGMRALQFETIQQLAEHAAMCVDQVLAICGCEVYQHLPETEQLGLLGASGIFTRPERRISLNDRSLPLRDALTHDFLLLNDIPDIAPYNENAFLVRHQIQHCLIVTIPGMVGTYGLLVVYSQTAEPFVISDVYFLQSLANIIGTFVEAQRSREQQRRHTDMMLALREAVTLVVTEADLPSVMQRILSSLQTLIPNHDASTLMLLDETDGLLHVVAHRGYEAMHDHITRVTFKVEDNAKYRYLARNHFVVVPDTNKDPDWEYHPQTAWIRSYLGAPILIDGKFVGLINLDSQHLNAFTDADGIVLSVFAEKVSLAIRNASRTADLEREVRERTHDLRAEQQRLQTILEATGDGILYLETGITRYVNRALSQLTGYSRAELLDQPIENILTGLIAHPAIGRIERCEGQLQCKNGEVLPVELTLSALQGETERMVIVARDISARQALEMQQQRFIINAAHELRTPVTNLNTRLYLLERQPEKLAEHLPVLKRISVRMNRLVNDLLDAGSIEQGFLSVEKRPIILQTVLEETFELLQGEADQKNICATLNLLAEPLTIRADAHRLQQVFTNLLANAIAYTPNGGRVWIEQRLEGDTVIVDVGDNGIGIALEHQQAIFEPFYRVQTRHIGTGLGLAIALEIVKLHDGRIRLESEPGRGSIFSVVLPLNE